MSSTAYQIRSSASMIDDYLYTAIPPVAQDLTSKFIVVEDLSSADPIAELVTVSSDDQVLHISPDPQSNSGWAQNVVPIENPPTGSVSKLLAFYEGGTLNVLAHYSSDGVTSSIVWMQLAPGGQWSAVPMQGDIGNALGKTTLTDAYEAAGSHYLYGISTNFLQPTFFIVSRTSDGNWGATFLAPSQSSSYRILPGTGTDLLTAVWVNGPSIEFRGLQYANDQFQWDTNPGGSFDLQQGNLDGSQIIPVPGQTGGTMSAADFLLLGNNGQLYYVAGYNQNYPTSTFLSGQAGEPQGVSAVAVGADDQQLAMIFVLDAANNMLWLLRQTGTDGNGNLTFGGWAQLGNVLTYIACPTRMGQGPELLAVDPGRNILHLIQNVTPVISASGGQQIDGTWFLTTVEGPAPSTQAPRNCPVYANELQVVDSNGIPVPSVLMNISADRTAVIVANGISYHVDANRAAQVMTNASGRITVSIAATNVTAPVLNVNVPLFMPPGGTQPVRSDTQLFNRLAGSDPQFPISGTTLKESGLISTEDIGLANDLASAVTSVGQTMAALASANTSEERRMKLREVDNQHWELDFAQPGEPRFRALSQEEAKAEIERALAAGPQSLLSDVWGDVANFVENVVEDLTRIVASIVDDVVNIAVSVANQVKTFVLRRVDQVGDLLETIFVKIAELAQEAENAIEKALDWLKLVFDWNDILNTKEVVKYYINQALTNIANSTTPQLVDFVKSEFGVLITTVTNTFNNLENIIQSLFPNGQTFEQYATQTNGGGQDLLQYDQFQAALSANATQCNYISTKTEANFGSGASLAAAMAMTLPDTTPFDTLVSTITTSLGDDFFNALQNLQNYLSTISQQGASILEEGILGMVEAAKQAVLFIINVFKDILIALINALGSMVTSLQQTLNGRIDIPFVSWLYQQIANSDLTIIDLVSLFIATPSTILYKAMFGGGAPFTPEQVKSITSSPIPWATIPSEKAPRPAGIAALPGDSSTARTMALMSAITWAFYGILADVELAGLAYLTEQEQAQPLNFWWSLVGIGFELVIQATAFPVAAANSSVIADIYAIVLWAGFLVPLALDVVCTVGDPVRAVTRFNKKWGRPARIACGALLLGLGLGVSVVQEPDPNYNGWNIASNLIGQWPLVGTGLYYSKNQWAMAGIIAMHLVCDAGMGFVTFMGAPSATLQAASA